MESFPIFSTPLTYYVAARWLVALASSACLLYVFLARRYLFVKPSLQLLLLHHVFFQWPAAIYAEHLEANLPDPWVLFGVLDVYMAFCFCLTLAGWRADARLAYARIRAWRFSGAPSWASPRTFMLLGGTIAAIVALYLVYVPFTSTGLYVVLFNPVNAALAREDSLKLMENRPVAYAYSLLGSAVIPVALLLLAEGVAKSWKKHRLLGFSGTLGMFWLSCCAMLPGSRYALVRLAIGLMFWQWLRSGMRLRLRYPGYALVALLPAAVFSVLRESQPITEVVTYLFTRIILHRVFVTPLEVGTWYLDFAHWNGFLGAGGFAKLAELAGYVTTDLQNVIGLKYANGTLLSVSAGAGFIFSYYARLGLVSIPLCALLTIALDLLVPLYGSINVRWLTPLVAVVFLGLLSMIQGDYTVALWTHGLLPAVGVALVCGRLDRPGVLAPPNGPAYGRVVA